MAEGDLSESEGRASVASRLPGANGLERAIAGVVEETIVRTVGSEAVVHAIERIIDDGRLQRAVEEAIDEEKLEQAIRRALDSQVADRVWEDVLASDKAQMLVERIAGAPEVRVAVAAQGFGLITDLGRQVARITTAIDAALERTARALLRRPDAEPRPKRAGLVTRALSAAVDGALIGAGFAIALSPFSGVPFLTGDGGPPWLAVTGAGLFSLFVIATYFTAFWALEGQTPGMRFLSIRLEDDDEDHRIGVRRAMRRLLGFVLTALTLGIGFLAVLVTDRRRNLADIVAGTDVVYDEEGTFAPWSVNEIPGAPG